MVSHSTPEAELVAADYAMEFVNKHACERRCMYPCKLHCTGNAFLKPWNAWPCNFNHDKHARWGGQHPEEYTPELVKRVGLWTNIRHPWKDGDVCRVAVGMATRTALLTNMYATCATRTVDGT